MPIETDFTFNQAHPAGAVAEFATPVDFLGPLRGLVGSEPAKQPKRTWRGAGFNMIWRPNFGNEFGNQDFFLELNLTDETLSFTDISGATGVANRGLLQEGIFLRRRWLYTGDYGQVRRLRPALRARGVGECAADHQSERAQHRLPHGFDSARNHH